MSRSSEPATGNWRAQADGGAVVSRNGRIAFVSNRDGNWEIYTAAADGRDQRRITTTRQPEVGPAWSNDGTHIAFARLTDRGDWDIFVVRADGSGERLVVGSPADDLAPAWSPDGARLAFTSNRDGGETGGTRYDGRRWAGRLHELFVVDPDGRNLHRMGKVPGEHRDPAWSPDGRRIAIEAYDADRVAGDIVVVDVATGASEVVFTNGAFNNHPTWAPDSSWIAFTAVRGAGSHIAVVPVSGGTARVVTSGVGFAEHPTWSIDGTTLLFSFDPDGSRYSTVPGDAALSCAALGGNVYWSPAHACPRGPLPSELHRVALNGSGRAVIVAGNGDAIDGTW